MKNNKFLLENLLKEDANITGDPKLKSAIEQVINDNPDLDGLELKRKIRADKGVKDALMGDQLHDNQLNRFIELAKGNREMGQRGRKPSEDASKTKMLSKILYKFENDGEFDEDEKKMISDLYNAMKGKMKSIKENKDPLNENFKKMEKLAFL